MSMSMIFFILAVSVFVGCVAAFLLLLAYKWDIVERMQVEGNEFVSKMAHCDFCMSWWLSVILTGIIMACLNDWRFFPVPFVSTPIARRLI